MTLPRRFFYGYVVGVAGFAIWFIGWGTYTIAFSVFLKPLLVEFGWSRAEVSLAYSASIFVQAGMGIVMGWLTDKLGPRKVVTVLGSFLGVCYLLMSQIHTLWQLQINYMFVGAVGASTLNVPIMVTMCRWFVMKRGLMIGIVQAGAGIGGLIFPPFAAWLILSYGWRCAYVILGIITFLGMIIAGLFLRGDPSDAGQLPDGGRPIMPQEVKLRNPDTQVVRFSLPEVVRTGQFWIIAGLYGSFGFCRSAFTTHIVAHVQDLGFFLSDGANVLAVIIGSSMFGRVGMGRLADIIGNRPVFMIGFGAMTVSLICGLVAKDLWMFYIFALIFGIAWGNQAVLRFALTTEVFGLSSLGVIMGVLAVGESIAAAFGSYFAGYIFDAVGSYQPAFKIGIGISAIGVILVGLLKPVRRSSSSPT